MVTKAEIAPAGKSRFAKVVVRVDNPEQAYPLPMRITGQLELHQGVDKKDFGFVMYLPGQVPGSCRI
jgi:hypothetical protein